MFWLTLPLRLVACGMMLAGKKTMYAGARLDDWITRRDRKPIVANIHWGSTRKPRIVLLPPGVSLETAQAVMDTTTEQAEPGNSQ